MSVSLPASMDAQLDALFEEHDSAANATTDPATPDPDPSPQALEATAESGDLDAAEDGSEGADDADGSLDAAAPEGDDEEEDASADADSDATPEFDLSTLPAPVRAQLEAAERDRRTLADLAAREEERRIAEENAKAEARYEQWQKTLAEMDPEDRQAEIIKVLSDGLGRVMLQQHQAQAVAHAQQQFQTQHSATLDFLSGGHRVEPTGGRLADGSPEYRRVDGASLPLTEAERKIVAKVTGGPLAMQQAADELVAMRRGQTAAARQALAQKRRDTNEPPTIGGGRQGTGTRPPEPPDYSKFQRLDDKLDAFFDYQDQHSGPTAGPARR